MKVLRAHRVELELTARQRRWCERACAASRVTYNWGLAEWRRWYRWQQLCERGHEQRARALLERWGAPSPTYEGGPSAYGVHARLTQEKKRTLSWLKEIENAYVPRESIAALGVAYAAFFRRLKKHRAGDHSECGRRQRGRCSLGAPRFHRRRPDEGFVVNQGSALRSWTSYNRAHRPRGKLTVPGLGTVRTKLGQQLPEGHFDAKATAICVCGATELKHASSCPAKLTKKQREQGQAAGTCSCGTTKLAHDSSCPARRSTGAWVGVEICGVGIRRWGGRWYASLRVRAAVTARARQPERRLAVEVGVRYRAVTYTEGDEGAQVGTFSDTRADRRIQQLERRRKLWERRLQRRYQRGVAIRNQSRGWFEARAKVSKLHRMIAQVRADRIHWTSRQIVNSGAEQLVVREMAVKDLLQRGARATDADRQTRNVLAHDVASAGMAELRRQLEYKQAWAGGETVVVPREEPETRCCAACGQLAEREPGYPDFLCRSCGHQQDRDSNAARVRYDYRPPAGEPVASPGTPGSNGGTRPANGRENRITGSRRPSGGADPDRSGKGAVARP